MSKKNTYTPRRKAQLAAYYQEKKLDPEWRADRQRRKDAWVAANKEKHSATKLARDLRVNYGLTVEQYNEMRKAQDYCCAVCGREEILCPKRKFHVDHCHQTKIVRGLLCSQCNTALGLAGDNPITLRQLAAYLEART